MFEKKKLYRVCWFLIIGIGLLTRTWQLMDLPFGFHIDEAGMAYDAWSLAEYGVDRHLKSWPVYLTNFGGGQSSLYAFICAILFKIFGFHWLIIRIPGVLFSLLTVIFGMKNGEKIWGRFSPYSLMLGLVLAISPYFIMAGRFGLDCNLFLGMSTIFIYCFMDALEEKTYFKYFLAGVMGGLVLYTYAISYFVMVFFLILSFIYCIIVKELEFKKWCLMAIPLGILALPLILVQIINIYDLEEIRFGWFTITKLSMYRASEIQGFQWELLIDAWKSVFDGCEFNYNTAPGYPNLLWITKPFFFLGSISIIIKTLLAVIQRKREKLSLILFWCMICFGLGGFITTNSNKINGIFFVVICLSVEGIRILSEQLGKRKTILLGLIAILYMIYFVKFSLFYFGGQYRIENPTLNLFQPEIEGALSYLAEDDKLRDRKTYMGQYGIYYLIGSRIAPNQIEIQGDLTGESQNNFYFTHLGEIEEDCNYIVNDIYEEYAEELRSRGFIEMEYKGYSLFYKK